MRIITLSLLGIATLVGCFMMKKKATEPPAEEAPVIAAVPCQCALCGAKDFSGLATMPINMSVLVEDGTVAQAEILAPNTPTTIVANCLECIKKQKAEAKATPKSSSKPSKKKAA